MHWSTPVSILTVVLLVLLLAAGLAWWREHTLQRQVGSFRCSVGATPDGPWRRGVARFGSDNLYWWGAHSLASAVLWPREGFVIEHRSPVHGPSSFGAAVIILTCRIGPQRSTVHLALSPAASAGLTSWIEATPGRQRTVI